MSFATISTVVEYRDIKTEEWEDIPSRKLDSSYLRGPVISSRLRPTILAGVFMGFPRFIKSMMEGIWKMYVISFFINIRHFDSVELENFALWTDLFPVSENLEEFT
jgi:hypothetical protein